MSEPKIDSVSPSPAAAAPGHPDHDRWVKEQTLALEVAAARAEGRTLRDAERANNASLERLAGKKRELRAAPAPAGPTVDPDAIARADERIAARGVTRTAPTVRTLVPSRCRSCGRCLVCRRDMRILAINQSARKGDLRAAALAWDLAGALLAMQGRKRYRGGDGREYDFARLNRGGRERAFNALVASVCDRSVKLFGVWRP